MAAIPELEPIIAEHYNELALNQDKVPLAPRWNIYDASEQANELLFVTCREHGKLVGYFIGFVTPGLHYSTCLTCNMDIFYISKEFRGGSLGIRLFSFVERELRTRGVQRFFVGSKTHADASALFKRLKFNKVETYYSKWIGD